jgi:hypothetical protein
VSGGSEESGTGRRVADGDDPIEEETHSMPISAPGDGDSSTTGEVDPAAADAETTTFGTGQAPPALIEEEQTVVAPVPRVSDAEEGPARRDASGPEQADLGDASLPELEEMRVDRGAIPSPADAGPTVLEAPPEPERRVTITGSPVAPSAALRPMLLERLEPSLGRGERLRLDGAHSRVTLGRAEQSDIRLYTASASREHAVIEGSADGEWVLTPIEGKRVLIDGAPTEEAVVLETGMNLILGADHLRCLTEGLDRDQMTAQTSAEGWGESADGIAARLRALPAWGWAILVLGLLGIGSLVLGVL